jgi:hypothetical protein
VSNYEFNADQNRIIGGLATRMGIVGTVALVAGLLIIIASVFSLLTSTGQLPAPSADLPDEARAALTQASAAIKSYGNNAYYAALGGLFQGLLLLALGIFARRGASGFRAVVHTQGDDITHLMGALDAQRRFFGVVATVLTLAILIGVANTAFQLYQRFGHSLPW